MYVANIRYPSLQNILQKIKLSLSVTKHYAMSRIGGGGRAPFIPEFDTKWK